MKNFILYGDIPTKVLIKRGLTVGKNFSRQNKTIIDSSHCNLIVIGDDVVMAPNSYILAHDASMRKALSYTKLGKVNIGDRVFIGASSIIMPGVVIGNDVIIGAGSVVSKDIPDNSVVVGNPATVILKKSDYLKRIEESEAYKKDITIEDFISSDKRIAYTK